MKLFLTYILFLTCHCLSAQKELKRANHEEFKLSDVNDSLHIKTATYTWLVRSTHSNVKHYQLRLYYDQNGKITKAEHSTKRNRETTSTEFYAYDSLAQLVQVKQTVRASDLDSLLFQTDYVYGLNSKTEIYQDFTDTVPNTRTTKYFFDEFGNVHLDSIFYNGEFTNRISRTFVYDSLGRIKLDNSYLEYSYLPRTEYFYTDTSYTIRTTSTTFEQYYKFYTSNETTISFYDNGQKKTEQHVSFSPEGQILQSTFSWYDKLGFVKEYEAYTLMAYSEPYTTRVVYIRDSLGNIICEKTYANDDIYHTHYKCEYEYW